MDKITELAVELEKSRQDAQLAAEYGKLLMEENTKLRTQLDSDREQYRSTHAKLEQDYHVVSKRLETATKMEEHLTTELENAQSLYDQKVTELSKRHQRDIETYTTQIANLRAQVSSDNAAKADLFDEIDELRKAHADKPFPAPTKLSLSVADDDTSEGDKKEEELDEAKLALSVAREEIEQLHGEIGRLRKEIAQRDASVEEASSMLEDARKTIGELKTDLEDARGELIALDQHHREASLASASSKGNSLFGEVDDHRTRVETALRNERRRIEALRAENADFQRQLQDARTQLWTFVQLTRAGDAERVEHMERQSQAVSLKQLAELNDARARVSALEQRLAEYARIHALAESSMSEKDYQVAIIAQLRREVQVERAEKDKQAYLKGDAQTTVIRLEGELRDAKTKCERLSAELMHSTLQREELRGGALCAQTTAARPVQLPAMVAETAPTPTSVRDFFGGLKRPADTEEGGPPKRVQICESVEQQTSSGEPVDVPADGAAGGPRRQQPKGRKVYQRVVRIDEAAIDDDAT